MSEDGKYDLHSLYVAAQERAALLAERDSTPSDRPVQPSDFVRRPEIEPGQIRQDSKQHIFWRVVGPTTGGWWCTAWDPKAARWLSAQTLITSEALFTCQVAPADWVSIAMTPKPPKPAPKSLAPGMLVATDVSEEEGEEEGEVVDHPAHYGGKDPYEVVKVAEAWGFDEDAYLFNALKYVARAGKKHDRPIEDLEKAIWYLQRKIARLSTDD